MLEEESIAVVLGLKPWINSRNTDQSHITTGLFSWQMLYLFIERIVFGGVNLGTFDCLIFLIPCAKCRLKIALSVFWAPWNRTRALSTTVPRRVLVETHGHAHFWKRPGPCGTPLPGGNNPFKNVSPDLSTFGVDGYISIASVELTISP